jgi:hypothetical protein
MDTNFNQLKNMKNNELKNELENAFDEKLKDQISKAGNIENMPIIKVLYIHASLQNDLNILELLSEEGTNLRFSGYIDFTTNAENGTIDKKYNHFNPISVRGKYLGTKKEFTFDEKITIGLSD